ncbi:N5-glutamine S-adenosyl-L-methionine-dependent methyltransferase [Paenibacillus sp. J31TS4]|uniref:putative protein N(5)-glutamine methyltransferase n=1 Tax=Paenibacillus sp. J31TS4 TaxID=2807195 RepID=UPI001B1ACE27|nr:putative protein N(5)-glutamine methyltransferase [Paenibacillus sp. J31TS4]GIP39523.1 N5-glutamine S-adenosyl-L-methionine-dependent methyltransferase [Paenibacillus sp. J31TS4]
MEDSKKAIEASMDTVAGRLRQAGCVFAEEEARLLLSASRTPAELDAMIERRTAGEPLEQIIGWAPFCGLRIEVEPGVFVPRQRSELLVREAASLAEPGGVVVDLCCGSGALGAALAAALGPIELYAVDIDPAAVRCARRNIAAAGGRVYQGDLYAPLPAELRGRIRLLVANVPYVPTEAIRLLPPEARLHEPLAALDGGADGLDIQRRVAAEASLWLEPGGHLLVEASERQAPQSARLFAASGLLPRIVHCAEREATIVIGRKPIRQEDLMELVPVANK